MMSKTKRTTKLTGARRAFTLIELMVVLAITAILLTLIFKPLIDGFNLTSRSNAQIQSQQLARTVTREITTDLSNAVFVFDNSQQNALLNLWFTNKNGVQYYIQSQYTMLEYVAPARQLDLNPAGQPIDPTTGLPIYPTNDPVRSAFALPLTPGRALGRIWIGLTDNSSGPPTQSGVNGTPINPYTDKFEDPRAATKDNRYSLFQAEVLAYIQDPDSPGAYIPNLELFHTLDSNGNVVDTKTNSVLQIHDPNFWYDNSLAGDASSKGARKWAVPGWQDLNGDGKVEIWENWRAAATSMLNANRVDMVALDRDENNNIIYDPNNNNEPTVRPLALISPAYVDNDPGTPSSLGDAGNEAPAAASPSYTSQYGHWSGDPALLPFHVFVYRSNNPNQDPLTLNPLIFYETFGDGRIVGPQNTKMGDPAPTYQQYTGGAPYNGQTLSEVGPQIKPDGTWGNTKPQFAFTVDPEKGHVNFSFPASVLVHDANTPANPLPSVYSPADIDAQLTGAYQSRYLDLHLLPATATAFPWTGTVLNLASELSPLGQLDSTPLSGNVHITPGTEQVFGPDQRPGPHYGYRIQYTRVPATQDVTAIGPNQYKINYDDIPNAVGTDIRTRIGYIAFDSQPDTTTQDNPANGEYFTNALPTYKVNPTTGQNVLADPVEVYYNFQMNRPNDVVKMDYLTRERMNLKLEVRYYDPASSRPQITVLTSQVSVRNFQR